MLALLAASPAAFWWPINRAFVCSSSAFDFMSVTADQSAFCLATIEMCAKTDRLSDFASVFLAIFPHRLCAFMVEVTPDFFWRYSLLLATSPFSWYPDAMAPKKAR
jgi:hypothetical protein